MNIDNNINSQIYNIFGKSSPLPNQDKSTQSNYKEAESIKDKASISKAYTTKSEEANQNSKSDKEREQKIQQEVQKLRAIEEKVKAHERAHKAAGGQFTGAVSYTYTTGPDGKRYISGGEVPIQIVQGKTPDETIRNMEIVKRAALAPADPSPQDRAVAAQASQIEQQARIEKSRLKDEEKKEKVDNNDNNVDNKKVSDYQNPLNKKAVKTYNDFSRLFEGINQGKGLSLFA